MLPLGEARARRTAEYFKDGKFIKEDLGGLSATQRQILKQRHKKKSRRHEEKMTQDELTNYSAARRAPFSFARAGAGHR